MSKALRWARISLIYLAVIFLIVEVALRIRGTAPPALYQTNASNTHTPDALIGWKPVPGTHAVTLNSYGDGFTFTIDEDHSRISRPADSPATEPSTQLIGGSFFFGVGVDDHEAVGWLLQEQFPHETIKNFAIGGQGTYQALLGLERRLQQGDRTTRVIYGLISHHTRRNIASSDWLELLHYKRQRQDPKVPYVTLNQADQIERQAPVSLTLLPFSDYSATIYAAQKVLNRVLAYQREQEAQKAFEVLIENLNTLCKRHGATFYVAVLEYKADESEALYQYFSDNNIKYINCQVPLTEQNTIREDHHPIAEVHSEWATRIAEKLRQDSTSR